MQELSGMREAICGGRPGSSTKSMPAELGFGRVRVGVGVGVVIGIEIGVEVGFGVGIWVWV